MKAHELLGVNNMLQAAEGSLQRANWEWRDGIWYWEDDLGRDCDSDDEDQETMVRLRHGIRLKNGVWWKPSARVEILKGQVVDEVIDIKADTIWDCMMATERWLEEQGVRVPARET